MDLILCHTTADFDTLGAAVGLTRLLPGSRIVIPGGCHPAVREFLALHKDEYATIERRAVNPEQLRTIVIVDTQKRDRLGAAAQWLDLPQIKQIIVYDHHLGSQSDINATQTQIDNVGATTTIIVEQLQKADINLTVAEATVMALGIHVDTGSLTFTQATARDAQALAWLMQQGASLPIVSDYLEPGLSSELQELLTQAIESLQTATINGYTVGWVMLESSNYLPGLSGFASQLMQLTQNDALLLGSRYLANEAEERLTIIGRSQIPGTNLNILFQPLGGGGHAQAASISLRGVDPDATLQQLVENLTHQIPQPPTARDLMSSPVRTILPETTIDEAQRILLRYGHSGLSVVDQAGQLVGIVSRRDLDIALHHGFSHAPVKGYMTTNLKIISPETTLPKIQELMVTYDIGRLPVLAAGQLVGIVTRTDILREMHQEQARGNREANDTSPASPVQYPALITLLRDRLAPPLQQLLNRASQAAEKRGWHLYLVGGAVRDLLLAQADTPCRDVAVLRLPHPEHPTVSTNKLLIQDIDLVVDGFHRATDVGAGVELAKALQQTYNEARLEIHGSFQTAALLWHNDPNLDSLWVDIATARTEFYPYPAANPEVEASSIRQDLYRRDFTINALAMRLTSPRAGELLDFFGGLLDLQAKTIRVLHANSFIEDPTRIYRAVRFAVRLGFVIDDRSQDYIRYAIASGIYELQGENKVRPALSTRLKSELKYILQAPYWQAALRLLSDLGALRCIHPTLKLDRDLWRQLRRVEIAIKWHAPTLTNWLLRLETILAYLAPPERRKVAENLQLPDESIKRLQALADTEAKVKEILPQCQLKSQVVKLLHCYDLATLILLAVRSPKIVRRQIWLYITCLSQVQPPLNGNDLKALGYKPGPQYRQILEDLLAATLDGEINDRSSAEKFLLSHYPL
ncbi:CBS domain-containing protein [Aliterella atlantica]|uniref:Poly(A) polymerase n=1 Tax=Aliterella atlantica CENA595 TaxID=1618023 RepID=A0A0D8ZXV2_9CYAN|nr:CBS domain-containing protein [Aliterella atlantica]KJH73202.1 poly(A) polymerase [Aliterella atlantica CENA595]